MATKQKTDAAETGAVTANLPFVISTTEDIPATVRTVGARGEPNPIRETMDWMANQNLQPGSKPLSFFIPAAIDANITDASEREKAGKDAARKLGNKVGGIARSLNKARDGVGAGQVKFEQRVRSEVVDGRGDAPVVGVRVYLAAPQEAAAGETAQPAA